METSTYNYANVIIVWICCLLLSCSKVDREYEVERVTHKKIESFKLDKYGSYIHFGLNDSYITTYDTVHEQLVIFEKEKEALHFVDIKSGSGPNEIDALSAIIIDEDNVVYLVDRGNAKIIAYDITREEKAEFTSEALARIFMRGEVYNDELILHDLNARDYLFMSYSPENDEEEIIAKGEVDLEEHFPVPPFKDGFIAVSDHILGYLLRFEPRIFWFDIPEKNFFGDMVYEDYGDVGYQMPDDDAGVVIPPDEVPIANWGIIRKPRSNGQFLLSIEGSSESEVRYERNHLYVMDPSEGQIKMAYEISEDPDNIYRYLSSPQNAYYVDKDWNLFLIDL